MNKRILVAPLNWGLGHATRCIPIIKALIKNKYTPIIACDGEALELLKKEFPELEYIKLPTYNISYSKNKYLFKLKLLQHVPRMLQVIKAEKKIIEHLVKTHNLAGIISDNRLGMYSKQVPCVFITHQLQVLSGNTTWLSTKIHNRFMKHFDACWIPDYKDTPNLSGKLGHVKTKNTSVKYLGPISRLKKLELPKKYDIMVLLSGPEPQRTLLEEKLLNELKNYSGTVLFVRGVIEAQQTKIIQDHITVYNFMIGRLLETSLNESKLIISRSGYTTIMDLATIEKQAFFIPTPGQFEQMYLAKKLDEEGLVPSSNQKDFNISKLEKITDYKGLCNFKHETNYKDLFSLFQTK